jgi:hypothetical protein
VPTIAQLRRSLEQAAIDAKELFFAATTPKSRVEYFAKGQLGDRGSGAVYAYFAVDGAALYVGEASRPIKRRMHDQTSPHKNAAWWQSWTTVRLLGVTDRTDRLAMELLLILVLKPAFNSKPAAREFAAMFE